MDLRATTYDVTDQVATLTLSRPHRHNAWTGTMHTEYRHLLDVAEADSAVRAIIVTGDPEGRAFCVGGDSEALAGHVAKGGYDAGTAEDIATPGYGLSPAFDADFAYQFGLTKPIVVAANGAAAGVGLALTCFADVRFFATEAAYTCAHGRLGLPAEFGLSWTLPRLVGLTRAADLVLSSRRFTGAEAAEIGLATAAVASTEVLPHAVEYTRELIANNSRASLRESKRQLYLDLHRSAAESVNDANATLAELMKGDDYREGVAALREKRPPNFR